MNLCRHCKKSTKNPNFCGLSCANKDQNSRKAWAIDYCVGCGHAYDARSRSGGRRKYCSKSCAAIANNALHPKRVAKERKHKSCLACGETLIDKSIEAKYCNGACHRNHIYTVFIERWKSGEVSGNTKAGLLSRHVKHYLRKKQKGACALCHRRSWSNDIYSGDIPLEGDHIDGNWRDSSEKNVRLICPTCHSTTDTYKAKNKGNGREYRLA